jgi:hypothetical protein
MQMEIETITDFLSFLPLDNFRRITTFANGVATDNGEESFGALIDWPSDQTEIIITGRLPSTDIWKNIGDSLKLVR